MCGRSVVESESYLYIYKPTHVIRSEPNTKSHKTDYLFFMVLRINHDEEVNFILETQQKPIQV